MHNCMKTVDAADVENLDETGSNCRINEKAYSNSTKHRHNSFWAPQKYTQVLAAP
jgi:hypothetical protein